MHTHEHTHIDENGNEYTHSHEHEHDHSNEHHHDHEHHHEHHHEGTPKEELIAMLKYMVGHNASHVQETKELAEQLKEEAPEAYAKIGAAVEEFEKGNGLLSEALAMIDQ